MKKVLFLILSLLLEAGAFAPCRFVSPNVVLRVTEDAVAESSSDNMEPMDSASNIAMEKMRRAQELRAQEVFMKRSTGKYKCSNCNWEYDETKGDSFMIGGMIQPGTPFAELPSNWRCPTCRASKDSFIETLIEIPGFAVNQGYGLGGNTMTGGQKNSLIFGGLFAFFLLFMAGYGLS